MTREVVVVSAVRTAIGTFGGSLKDIPAHRTGSPGCPRVACPAPSVDGKDVGHVVFGHVVNTEPKDMYLSRVAAINGGCAEAHARIQRKPAVRLRPASHSLGQPKSILLGDTDVAIGGGAENMSRAPVRHR
jgi:acetyl-CoA C-acetyltransferase